MAHRTLALVRLPILNTELAVPPLDSVTRPVDKLWRPVVAVWELTLRCDLACNHCGSRAGHARARELSTEECLKVADELARFGVKEVSLIGGEAYLHPGWLEVVARLGSLRVRMDAQRDGRKHGGCWQRRRLRFRRQRWHERTAIRTRPRRWHAHLSGSPASAACSQAHRAVASNVIVYTSEPIR